MRVKIKDYNYEVDRNGEVYNCLTGKKKKQSVNLNGYKVVYLYKNNKATCKSVHRLIALAFIPNPENKPCVNHINGVKTDNRVENLEWNTYSENTIHSYENGLQRKRTAPELYNTIYEESYIHQICSLMEMGYRNVEIEEKLNAPRNLLKNIRSGKAWLYISKEYKIPSKSTVVSEQTILWIVDKIQKGYRNKEIVELSNNPKIDKSLVSKIKNRTLYSEQTKHLEW